ncbi:hypothetical protein B296_00003550 [Ensete ventricosum]|uniref:DAGKc domain-containing protein n=1 Tax=Ensete ventricosum TaxID=4639 RepID=A0A427B8W8_ENSVE|nr:hypothetical protein B296_00003550 [Ensete ventricosum]
MPRLRRAPRQRLFEAWMKAIARTRKRRKEKHKVPGVAHSDICDLGPFRRLILSPLFVKDLSKTEKGGFLSSITHGANELASTVRGHIMNQTKKYKHEMEISADSADNNSANGSSKDSIADSYSVSKGSLGNGEHCNGVTEADNCHQGGDSDHEDVMKAEPRRSASFTQKDDSHNLVNNQKYELVDIPSDARPLLVFINKKSGAQRGDSMRRRFFFSLPGLILLEIGRRQSKSTGMVTGRKQPQSTVLPGSRRSANRSAGGLVHTAHTGRYMSK